jgi:hypothetical protein
MHLQHRPSPKLQWNIREDEVLSNIVSQTGPKEWTRVAELFNHAFNGT